MLAPFARASALAIVAALGALASSVVAAPLTDAVAAPIRGALAALNAGDAHGFARAFAPEATITTRFRRSFLPVPTRHEHGSRGSQTSIKPTE